MTYNPSSINVGSAPNDNTGDPARTAFQKVNTNFTSAATAINSITNVTALSDPGYYSNTGDRTQDWLVVARNLTSTLRMTTAELVAANMQFFSVAGSYTYTLPPGASTLRIYCMGSGGGGGGGATVASGGSASGGAGGGGGAFCETILGSGTGAVSTNFATGGTITVVVGAGGTGGAGKASGSAGNGTAGSDGNPSYVADLTSYASVQYYGYANGGKGGGAGQTAGAASTGGAGASWIPSFTSSGIIAGSFAAGNTDTISTAAANNIVNPWCGGPGTGSSATNGSPTASAIVMLGSPGGPGGGSISSGTVKSPGTAGFTNLWNLSRVGSGSQTSGGAASTTTNGSNGSSTSGYGGYGGGGGGAAYSTFTGGTGAAGAAGFVLIIATF
jgi:hypothetical protein